MSVNSWANEVSSRVIRTPSAMTPKKPWGTARAWAVAGASRASAVTSRTVRRMKLDTVVRAETPEGIDIALRPAGVAPRALAYALDWTLRQTAFLVAITLLQSLRGIGEGLLLAEGVIDLAMGILVLLFPAGAVLGFVIATAAWALLTGGLMLGAAFRLHASHGRWWLGLAGVVSLLWGVVLILTPFAGALVLTWWLGGYAIVFGVSLLVLAFRLRGHRGHGTSSAAQLT